MLKKLGLESVKNQDYPEEKIEIIIAHGGSTDGTLESVQSDNEFPSLSIIIVAYNCAQNLQKCLEKILCVLIMIRM